MKYLFFIFLFLTQTALACWKAEGSFAVDGETFKFSQRIDHNKEYKFPGGNFIFSFTINPKNKDLNQVLYKIEEKIGTKLILVTEGEDEITNKKKTDIFAKGKADRPNSILTFKLTDI